MSKYNNKKCSYQGIDFDSKTERDFYIYLMQLKQAGEVLEIELQPVFLLQEKFKHNNKNYRRIDYKADFKVLYSDGNEIVYDTKGFITDVFTLKKKMLLYKYPGIDFRCIKKAKGAWVEI